MDTLEKYGYSDANKCGEPMEINARMAPETEEESAGVRFDCRGAFNSLMYLSTGTCPNLAYALVQLSQFLSKPTAKHLRR